jgi:hypothetical protein
VRHELDRPPATLDADWDFSLDESLGTSGHG